MNTEPIAVSDALKLCEMAIEECDKLPNRWTGPSEFVVGWGAPVMRPMVEYLKCEIEAHAYHEHEYVESIYEIYPPLAALRDHYDAVRPDWRMSK